MPLYPVVMLASIRKYFKARLYYRGDGVVKRVDDSVRFRIVMPDTPYSRTVSVDVVLESRQHMSQDPL